MHDRRWIRCRNVITQHPLSKSPPVSLHTAMRWLVYRLMLMPIAPKESDWVTSLIWGLGAIRVIIAAYTAISCYFRSKNRSVFLASNGVYIVSLFEDRCPRSKRKRGRMQERWDCNIYRYFVYGRFGIRWRYICTGEARVFKSHILTLDMFYTERNYQSPRVFPNTALVGLLSFDSLLGRMCLCGR